jgi:hypothetical protein
MRKDINSKDIVEKSRIVSASESQRPMEQRQQQRQQQQQQRRGEKERNEWLNRDATRNGSFFEGRKSLRDIQSEEERAWTTNIDNNPQSMAASRRSSTIGNSLGSMTGSSSISSGGSRNNNPDIPPSISGQFRRSFHALMQNQHHRDRFNNITTPPWEIGPESLRLPRYRKVVRASSRPTDSVPVREDMNVNGDQWSLENR